MNTPNARIVCTLFKIGFSKFNSLTFSLAVLNHVFLNKELVLLCVVDFNPYVYMH